MKDTKEDLKRMGSVLNLSIPSKLRKEEYAKAFADAILIYPEMWLPQLTHYELTLLQKLVEAGRNSYIEVTDTLIASTLEYLSLVITDRRKRSDAKIRYMICDELRETIAPHLNRMSD